MSFRVLSDAVNVGVVELHGATSSKARGSRHRVLGRTVFQLPPGLKAFSTVGSGGPDTQLLEPILVYLLRLEQPGLTVIDTTIGTERLTAPTTSRLRQRSNPAAGVSRERHICSPTDENDRKKSNTKS